MAIISSVMMSKARGSLGNITLSTVKGRVIAKEKATIVGNPRTAEQQKQRKALADTVRVWKAIGRKVESGMTEFSRYGNRYSGFISNNIEIMKEKNLEEDNFKGMLLEELQATSGNYSKITPSVAIIEENLQTIKIREDEIPDVFKKDSKLNILLMEQNSMNCIKIVADIESGVKEIDGIKFEISETLTREQANGIKSIWLESADGKLSTNSFFE